MTSKDFLDRRILDENNSSLQMSRNYPVKKDPNHRHTQLGTTFRKNMALCKEGVGFNQCCPAIQYPARRDRKHPAKAICLLDGGEVEGHISGWEVSGTQTFADVMVVLGCWWNGSDDGGRDGGGDGGGSGDSGRDGGRRDGGGDGDGGDGDDSGYGRVTMGWW